MKFFKIKIVLFLLCSYSFLFLFNLRERIILRLQYIIGQRDLRCMPLHPKNVKLLLNVIDKSVLLDNYTNFYDIGCGEGNVLEQVASKNLFKYLFGVEISLVSYEKAKQKFRDQLNVKIINKSMDKVIYVDEPSIIYLYEPLWSIKSTDKKLQIYNDLMQQLNSIQRVIIIYFTGFNYKNKDIKDDFMEKFGYTLIQKKFISNDIIFLKTALLQVWKRDEYKI